MMPWTSVLRPHRSDALSQSLVESFARSVDRHLGFTLRPCQITAATHLASRSIAELPTGEGKTLAVALAAIELARHHDQVLIATANDYLARRDATWMQPLYEDAGLGVSSIHAKDSDAKKRIAYQSRIVYGTIREFAFDHLKHALSLRQSRLSRGLAIPEREAKLANVSTPPFSFAALIVDEADSVLIDEARVPLVIATSSGTLDQATEACFRWSADFAGQLDATTDFVQMPESGAVAITAAGRMRVWRSTMPGAMRSLTTTEIFHSLERAIWVNLVMRRDVHYVVQNDRVYLVDEHSGRKSMMRSFGGGVQQAIEARERLALTNESHPVARISVQDFVAKFKHLCGITATAWEDRSELRTVYGLKVHRVQPHVPSRRIDMSPVVTRTVDDKYAAIVRDASELIRSGRAVLIGTRTVAQSVRLSESFHHAGIDHAVLNATNDEHEAQVIAEAGSVLPTSSHGRVTIATNMAGRGTDIPLDSGVAAAGGLHVIVSHPHAAKRIDRQFFGRSGRQGDPGSTRLYCSPDDELVDQAFDVARADRIRDAAARGASDRWILSRIARAQRTLAHRHRLERARLTAYEASLREAFASLGLDPHLDPLPNRD